MAKYIMQEMPDLHHTGKRIMYPKFEKIHPVGIKELAERMERSSGFSAGDIEGVLRQTGIEMARLMADGCSVKINGIGTFTPTLTLMKGKEPEEAGEGKPHRNAHSLCVGSVHFRPEKEMIRNLNQWCQLERSNSKQKGSSESFSAEERLQMVHKYLDEHPFLTVHDYRRMTGLLNTTATNELREWANQPDSGVGIQGLGTHKVYVKK